MEKVRAAAARAVATRQQGHDVVMVVSARGQKTDELVAMAEEMTEEAGWRARWTCCFQRESRNRSR